MNKRRKEFIDNIDYWKDKEDGVEGVIFSTLVLIDGCSTLNNCKRLNIDGITNNEELHSDFMKIKNERS